MRSIICLAAVAVVAAAFSASAATIVVDFNSDPAPVNVLNGFTSVDSSLIHFSDTMGDELIVLEFEGSNALATFFDDDSGLRIDFEFVASALSMDFGNTALADIGDTAVLTLLLGDFEVDSTTVALNSIDQTISYQDGFLFDSAIFRYVLVDGDLPGIEVVDNIRVTPVIPEPHAGLVFGMGALLVGAVCARRSPAEVELRTAHD
jgi:hypothetical protein